MQSVLELISKVISSNIEYDRVVMLSGCDYPVWSNEKIFEFFKNNQDKEFMIGYNITQSDYKPQLRKVTDYHLMDIKIKNKILGKLITKPINFLFKMLPINKKPYIVDENGKKYDIWFSSDWWALNYNTVKDLYNQFICSKKVQKYFKSSFAPSELFMATMLFNSKYKNNAYIYKSKEYKGLYTLTYLHFIDYSNGILVMNETDYNRIVESGKMFVRKTNTGMSDNLIKKLEQNKLNR